MSFPVSDFPPTLGVSRNQFRIAKTDPGETPFLNTLFYQIGHKIEFNSCVRIFRKTHFVSDQCPNFFNCFRKIEEIGHKKTGHNQIMTG